MTIKINYLNNPYEEIIKRDAYVTGLSISNQSDSVSTLDLDDLKFNGHHMKLKRNLPNGMSVEFLIFEISGTTLEKYKNFTTLSATFDGITIEATI